MNAICLFKISPTITKKRLEFNFIKINHKQILEIKRYNWIQNQHKKGHKRKYGMLFHDFKLILINRSVISIAIYSVYSSFQLVGIFGKVL